MGKTLLLISKRPEDQAFAVEVAVSAGLSLMSAPTYGEGVAMIAENSPSAILVDASSEKDYQEFETAVQTTLGLFSDKISANAIHFLSNEDLEKVPYLIQSPLFGHFVLRNYGDPRDAGQHYGRIVKATTGERAFGLDLLLSTGAKIQNVKLQMSNQKQEAVEAIRNYLVAAKFQTRMATAIANAVDELLMNAIFDAPVDSVGRPTLSTAPRNTVIKLESQQAVEMSVGYDGKYVAIMVADLFGSLDKGKLLNHISKIYTEEEYKVRTAVAGAGIGLATVFRSGGSFFFVSESRVRTEVTVFFRRCDSFRDFKDQFRFISTQFYF